MIKSWSSLKSRQIVVKKAKAIAIGHNSKVALTVLSRWKMEYIRNDITNRLAIRREKVRVVKSWSAFKNKTREMRRRRLIGEKIKGKKDKKRVSRVWKALKEYQIIARKVKLCKRIAKMYKQRMLLKKALKSFRVLSYIK